MAIDSIDSLKAALNEKEAADTADTTETETQNQDQEKDAQDPGAETPEGDAGASDTQEKPDGEGETETDGAEKAPEVSDEYKPNFHFRASDKDLEIEEIYRPLIKDAETEKKVRELHEKAYGLESVKADRQKVRDEFKEVSQKHEALMQNIQELGQLRQVDLKGFLEQVGVKWEDVLEKVVEEVRLRELPPEQRQAHEQSAKARRQAFDQSRDLEKREADYNNRLAQMTAMQIDAAISQSDVAAVAQAFDSRPNKPYSFKDLVYNLGSVHYQRTKEFLPPHKAVEQAIAIVGPSLDAGNGAPSAPPASVTATAGSPKTPTAPPPPNVKSGRTASPTSRIFKSVEELEAYAEQKLRKG